MSVIFSSNLNSLTTKMIGSVYFFIWYSWFFSIYFPFRVVNKKMFLGTLFGRFLKQPKSLDSEKFVLTWKIAMIFELSIKNVLKFVVRPSASFFTPILVTLHFVICVLLLIKSRSLIILNSFSAEWMVINAMHGVVFSYHWKKNWEYAYILKDFTEEWLP